MNEKFSAFLDNEATRDEADSVVNRLLRDESLRDSWTRQYWIREALRTPAGEPTVVLDTGFSERVMQAVRSEDRLPATGRPTVVSMPRRTRRRRWQTMAGFAVAASAAGFALFATQPLEFGVDTMPASSNTVATGQPSFLAMANAGSDGASGTAAGSDQLNRGNAGGSFGYTTRGVSDNTGFARDDADRWQVSDPVLANRLNDYLVEHNGLARGYGLSATTPGFVRVAAYGQGVAR